MTEFMFVTSEQSLMPVAVKIDKVAVVEVTYPYTDSAVLAVSLLSESGTVMTTVTAPEWCHSPQDALCWMVELLDVAAVG